MCASLAARMPWNENRGDDAACGSSRSTIAENRPRENFGRPWSCRPIGATPLTRPRAGPFDPLATFQLLQFDVPFVPVTRGSELLKVIDRVGVATELARAVVERRLGRG